MLPIFGIIIAGRRCETIVHRAGHVKHEHYIHRLGLFGRNITLHPGLKRQLIRITIRASPTQALGNMNSIIVTANI